VGGPRRGERNLLRVGVHGPPFRRVAELLDAFRRVRPDVALEQRELTLITQERALIRGQVDVVFNVGVPDTAQLRVLRLGTERRVLAVPPRHPFADCDSVSLDQALDEVFISLHPAVPSWCDDLFSMTAQRGAHGHRSHSEASSAAEVLELAALGQGVYTAPAEFAAHADTDAVAWKTVTGLSAVSLDLVALRTNRSPAVGSLFELASATAA
jgi:DNA-binding transcriptional LysR family regulator